MRSPASSAGSDAPKFLPKPRYRAFAEFAGGTPPDKIHAALIERALGGRIIRAIARDATEIEAREKPVQNKANDGKVDPPTPDNCRAQARTSTQGPAAAEAGADASRATSMRSLYPVQASVALVVFLAGGGQVGELLAEGSE
jgi:hypothetical protein